MEAMGSMTDRELLEAFKKSGSPDPFAEVVQRHTDMVYAVCRRILGDPHLAEDATQAVFLVLLRKAQKLSRDTLLAGWLYRTAELAARDLDKSRRSRARLEREAPRMKSEALSVEPESVDWEEIRPHLDAALVSLFVSLGWEW